MIRSGISDSGRIRLSRSLCNFLQVDVFVFVVVRVESFPETRGPNEGIVTELRACGARKSPFKANDLSRLPLIDLGLSLRLRGFLTPYRLRLWDSVALADRSGVLLRESVAAFRSRKWGWGRQQSIAGDPRRG